MKKIIRLIFAPLCIILLLAVCSSGVPITQNVKMLIGFGPGMDFCLINIYENGTVEYTSCSIINANLRNENIVREVYVKKAIRLSNNDRTIINELIQGILDKKPIKEIVVDDAVEVRALIRDEVYLSVYYDTIGYYDKNVAGLAYKLVELAPINVGGDHNPLRVPK